MAIDLQLIKDHPYATGGVVIVGGLIVFYLLSSSQGSSGASASTSTGQPDQSSALAYSAQLAQTQAAADVQNNAQQVQLQQTQLQAQIASQQIDASLQTNNVNTAATLAATLAQIQAQTQQNQDTLVAQTTQQGNQLVYAQNLQSMQDAVLESQINAGVVENANNNATALAGTVSTLDYQGMIAQLQAAIASQGLTIAGGLAQSQETDAATLAEAQQTAYEQNVQAILPNVGKPYNSGLDANNALALQETILAGGNPAVAAAGVSSSTAATISGNTSGVQTIQGIVNGITTLGTTVAKGLFATPTQKAA
jgi:multidrug efflux pump subunit AcrA (membrane-fusion protein)